MGGWGLERLGGGGGGEASPPTGISIVGTHTDERFFYLYFCFITG